MTPIGAIIVVVPARNEQDRILACLESIRRAERHVRPCGSPAPTVLLVVVADGCDDATVVLARSVPGVTVLQQPPRGVGAARGHGVAYGLARTGLDPRAVWIANTDADSRVPPHWLASQLLAADLGSDVVVGTVRPDFGELDAAQRAAWTATHRRGEPNGHVHGANLGIRASTYLAVGGFTEALEHEDIDLVGRARARGFAVLASDDGEVITSGRQHGRTPGGYARYLRTELAAARARARG